MAPCLAPSAGPQISHNFATPGWPVWAMPREIGYFGEDGFTSGVDDVPAICINFELASWLVLCGHAEPPNCDMSGEDGDVGEYITINDVEITRRSTINNLTSRNVGMGTCSNNLTSRIHGSGEVSLCNLICCTLVLWNVRSVFANACLDTWHYINKLVESHNVGIFTEARINVERLTLLRSVLPQSKLIYSTGSSVYAGGVIIILDAAWAANFQISDPIVLEEGRLLKIVLRRLNSELHIYGLYLDPSDVKKRV